MSATATDWLSEMCDEARPGLQFPFGMTVDGVPYTVVTDGTRLLGLIGLPCDREQLVEAVNRHVPGLLGHRPTERVIGRTTVAALREWTGSIERDATDVCRDCHGAGTTKCDECNGAGGGVCSHCNQDVECETCHNSGKVACEHDQPRRIGMIDGRPFNRFLLALPMHRLPDGVVEVCVDSLREREPFPFARFKGDGWIIVAMGLNLIESASGPAVPLEEVPA